MHRDAPVPLADHELLKYGASMAEIVYPPVIKTALGVFKALNIKFRLEGTEHIPRTGGAVLVSNHVSYLDFIFAGLAAHPAGRLASPVRSCAACITFRWTATPAPRPTRRR